MSCAQNSSDYVATGKGYVERLCGRGEIGNKVQSIGLGRDVVNPFLGIHRHIYALFDAVVACCAFCTRLVLNVVWPLIQGIQTCKLRSYRLHSYIAMVHLKLVNLSVEKQVMLPATLPDIESEILCCKIFFLPK